MPEGARRRETLLVVGASLDSLGSAVAQAAQADGYAVGTAGLNNEVYHLDVRDIKNSSELFKMHWHHVVCTVGINQPGTMGNPGDLIALKEQLDVNVLGVARLLDAWWNAEDLYFYNQEECSHFVAISSNSAHIPRSKSGGYCASKAALEMFIRCVARDRAQAQTSIYAYSPGWLEGTPMSGLVSDRLKTTKPHRIPHGKGMDVKVLATLIVNNLKTGKALNGCIIPFDGGEI